MSHDHDHSHSGHDHSHAGHDHARGHAHDHGIGGAHVHAGTDKGRVLIAALLTAGFMVAEFVGGLVTGSLALIADAGHMLTDAVALSFAWYAFHLAGKPATGRMTYGFDRVKTLVAYTNGLAIFAIALFILYEAWQRLAEPAPVLGAPMLVIGILGMLVNIVAFFVLHGGDRENLNMRGAMIHVLGDLLGSAAAIAAALVIMATGWYPIDPILSVLVSILLFRGAWALVRDAGHVLLEGVPASLDRDAIASDVLARVEGLKDVHHMHVWTLDGTRNMATLHACADDGVDPTRLVRNVKARLASAHGIDHATVEVEYGTCADQAHEHQHA